MQAHHGVDSGRVVFLVVAQLAAAFGIAGVVAVMVGVLSISQGILYMVEQIRRFPPSVLGKITTFMHVLTVCLVLLGNIMPLPPLLLSGCFYTSFGFVIISGFDYIYRVSRSIEAARLEREAGKSTANSSL